MITVVIPTYNCADYIQFSLDSILAQERVKHVDIVVVDDGSTDHTQQIMEMYLDDITYIRNDNHFNANVARNIGAEYAKESFDNKYIVFADADCVYEPSYLKQLKHALQYSHKDTPFSYCDFNFEGIYIKSHKSGGFLRERLLLDNFIDTSAAMIKMEHLVPFDENLRRLQDWDLFLSITKKSERKPVYVEEVLYTNIVREESTSKVENYEEARQYVIKKHKV